MIMRPKNDRFASLCILAYKRPHQLKECLDSIFETADYPHEIIVNLDGDDSGNSEYLFSLYKNKRISKLIMNAGKNRGVGTSFANCVGAAEGDFIFKIDTDLIFNQKWLSTAVDIIENYPEVGAISLFDYRNYDPNDDRFEPYSEIKSAKVLLVDDFVSSIYGFRREYLKLKGWEQDDGFHKKIRDSGTGISVRHLAITKKDYCRNTGFGVTKSVYVSGTEENPFKTPTHNKPLLYNGVV